MSKSKINHFYKKRICFFCGTPILAKLDNNRISDMGRWYNFATSVSNREIFVAYNFLKCNKILIYLFFYEVKCIFVNLQRPCKLHYMFTIHKFSHFVARHFLRKQIFALRHIIFFINVMFPLGMVLQKY